MKWNTALTIEQAVLMAMDYKDDGVISYISLSEEIIRLFEREVPDEDLSLWFYECVEIYNALLVDAALAVENTKSSSVLNVHKLGYYEQVLKEGLIKSDLKYIDITKTLFTKSSFASWFCEHGDLDKALKVYPAFPPITKQEYTLLETYKADNITLKEKLLDLECKLEAKNDDQDVNCNDLSKFIPVVGEGLKTLSKALQVFPSRFPDYGTRNGYKHVIMKWLVDDYGCNVRNKDTFANILLQSFPKNK